MKIGSLWRITIYGRIAEEILKVPNIIYARIAYTPANDIFLIGGTNELEYSKLSSSCFKIEAKTGRFFKCSSMNGPRCNFGLTISLNRMCIYVAGGDISLNESTSECEMYDIEKNVWYALPSLAFPRANNSLCLFNDYMLYSFGGYTKNDIHNPVTDVIERLNLNETSEWQSMHLVLPYPVTDIGCVQASEDEILLFGGYNKAPLDTIFLIRI